MTSAVGSKSSPMMQQWQECKDRAPTALLFFRLGDFYEAFYEDAVLIARELDLTLTKRQEVPMCGVPAHTVETYIDRLIAKGYRIAVAEQMEDPKAAKGLVKRAVTRLITPGTVVTSSLLSDKSNNFLISLTQVGSLFGLSILDVTTADFRVMEMQSTKEVIDTLCQLKPSEIVTSKKFQGQHAELLQEIKRNHFFSLHIKEDGAFDHGIALTFCLKHFKVHSLDGFGLRGMVAAINAAGALLAYVSEDLSLPIQHITAIRMHKRSLFMQLNHTTERHLELTKPMQQGGLTLLSLLDHTTTPMGARLLKEWIHHPLLQEEEIAKRQDAIETLLLSRAKLEEFTTHLSHIRDLERLNMRIQTGYAHPRDLVALRLSLEPIAPLRACMENIDNPLIKMLQEKLYDMHEIVSYLEQALVDTPPLRLSEGGLFKRGFSKQLDELYDLKSDNHNWVARYQAELREQTGIKTLKIGFTKAFGYYIEVTRSQASNIPLSLHRKQTLVNAERFITEELKAYEHKILKSEELIYALEYELFQTLKNHIATHSEAINSIASSVAIFDVLISLAHVAKKHNYVRPVVDHGNQLQIKEGRHPVVEASLGNEAFIANDLTLNENSERLLVITGPNMAGKSTFIRQVALIVILAQMGSFIPAKEAHIGIIDKVFTRIGASDDLARGQSTFMVEMAETAHILHNATDRSLVILDEIGRGTSTYDGISIAWAVAEYLLTEQGKRAKTLFATHYWELTELEKKIEGAVNYNVAVAESESGIVFLRKIVKGGTDKSYGIHVARLAGLPRPVLKRAEALLTQLETKKPSPPKSSLTKTMQEPKQEIQLQLF